MKIKWTLRIVGILLFLLPFVLIALGTANTGFLLIGMIGAGSFIASFTMKS